MRVPFYCNEKSAIYVYMTFGKVDDTKFLLRLEPGDEINTTIQTFCKEQQIANASISGIGSVENPTLAHYRLDTKKFSEKQLTGIFEVTSLLGTVALVEKEPLVHLHITVSDENMHVYAGHLMKGAVSATLEVVLTVLPSAFEKKFSEEIGLKLYEFSE